VHATHILLFIVVIPEGNVIALRATQLENDSVPILVTELGKVRDVNFEQRWKTKVPTVSKVAGSKIEVTFVNDKKAESCIVVMLVLVASIDVIFAAAGL